MQHVWVQDVAIPGPVSKGLTRLTVEMTGCSELNVLAGYDFEALQQNGLEQVTLRGLSCPDLESMQGMKLLTLDRVDSPSMPLRVQTLHLHTWNAGEPLTPCEELFLDHIGVPDLAWEDPDLLRLRVHEKPPAMMRPQQMHALRHLEVTVDCLHPDVRFPALESLKLLVDGDLLCSQLLAKHRKLKIVSVQGQGQALTMDVYQATPVLLFCHVHVHALMGAASVQTILLKDASVCKGVTHVQPLSDFDVQDFPYLVHHL
jgi:hypothetical protein